MLFRRDGVYQGNKLGQRRVVTVNSFEKLVEEHIVHYLSVFLQVNWFSCITVRLNPFGKVCFASLPCDPSTNTDAVTLLPFIILFDGEPLLNFPILLAPAVIANLDNQL